MPELHMMIPIQMTIEELETSGDMPGWLSGHKAYIQGNSKILVTGGETYSYKNGKHEYDENKIRYQLCTINNIWIKLSN